MKLPEGLRKEFLLGLFFPKVFIYILLPHATLTSISNFYLLYYYVLIYFLAENSKSLSVLHIGPEASTKNHHYFESRYVDQVGEQPLLATVILYLSNVSQGGQLLFPQSKVKRETSPVMIANMNPCVAYCNIFVHELDAE